MYARWTGKSGPAKLGGAHKPRDFNYALCRHYTALQAFDEDALVAAGRKMLRPHLQERWFGSGTYIRAATWLSPGNLFSDKQNGDFPGAVEQAGIGAGG